MARVNPIFTGIKTEEVVYNEGASVKGVGIKTTILFLVALASAAIAIMFRDEVSSNTAILVVLSFGALISGIIGQLSYKTAMVSSFIYAICEGALLGLVSFLFEAEISGIVLGAIMVTATIFGVMLFLYSANIIKVTNRFVKMMMAILITSVIISIIFSLIYIFAPRTSLIVSFLSSPGLYLLICVFDLLYAAFMLMLDFEQIKTISNNGFDKAYEWNAALGLMITIIWIYVEILRIIAIFASKKD